MNFDPVSSLPQRLVRHPCCVDFSTLAVFLHVQHLYKLLSRVSLSGPAAGLLNYGKNPNQDYSGSCFWTWLLHYLPDTTVSLNLFPHMRATHVCDGFILVKLHPWRRLLLVKCCWCSAASGWLSHSDHEGHASILLDCCSTLLETPPPGLALLCKENLLN